ncbi:SH2 domain-containing protein [Caenorhabditis elegans]|uniref:SH2 domain-containing protein n=1 Tax=Caenorhabditis elegans TaxID=6239 RepID=Q18065_CAEEL|nr:SH2 domain-containing protein [Caenorhabditis elegans]CCD65061.1 SH2 domain-containing protein [Caenorhabditis elegans]|eukprot:NP_509354.1 Uncharacterized protein CELE_C18A11.4 [Caenorhabditis elegans]
MFYNLTYLMNAFPYQRLGNESRRARSLPEHPDERHYVLCKVLKNGGFVPLPASSAAYFKLAKKEELRIDAFENMKDIHFLHEKQTWFFDKLDVNFGKELLYWNGPHIGQFLIIRNNFSYTICYVCQMEDLMVIRERKIIFDISKPENGFRFSPIEKPKRDLCELIMYWTNKKNVFLGATLTRGITYRGHW